MDRAGSLDEEGKEGTYLVGKLSENTYFEDVKIMSKLMIVCGFSVRGMN